MSAWMQDVDERAKLAGTNKFELLLFRLGTDGLSGSREVFGINVFKVREALVMPPAGLGTPQVGTPSLGSTTH